MKEAIIARINDGGPVPFDEYMEMCLYDPDGGYFTAGKVRSGRDADFLTSPEISPAFGRLIGRWALDARPEFDSPLVEVGAGSGSLLREVAPAWMEQGLSVYAVERSLDARVTIADRYPPVNVVDTLDDVPARAGAVIVANEVLDNMPAAIARLGRGGWREIGVGHDDGDLSLIEMEARPDVLDWLDAVVGNVPEGTVVTVQLAAHRWICRIARRFGRAAMCLVDYGAGTEELTQRDARSLVRTYRTHRTGVDWLAHPGESDITVDVNVDGVIHAAQVAGADVEVMSQREFLLDLGAGTLIEELIDEERRHAAGGAVMEQLVARSDRLAIEALLDDNGIGGFNVLLISVGT